MNQTLPSLDRGSLVITITVPSKVLIVFVMIIQCISDLGLDVERAVTAMKRVEDRGGTQTATKVNYCYYYYYFSQSYG